MAMNLMKTLGLNFIEQEEHMQMVKVEIMDVFKSYFGSKKTEEEINTWLHNSYNHYDHEHLMQKIFREASNGLLQYEFIARELDQYPIITYWSKKLQRYVILSETRLRAKNLENIASDVKRLIILANNLESRIREEA